jgi:hypothetical protein
LLIISPMLIRHYVIDAASLFPCPCYRYFAIAAADAIDTLLLAALLRHDFRRR